MTVNFISCVHYFIPDIIAMDFHPRKWRQHWSMIKQKEEWLVGAVVSVLQGQVDAEWTQGVV